VKLEESILLNGVRTDVSEAAEHGGQLLSGRSQS
jgi:hypothetical protein